MSRMVAAVFWRLTRGRLAYSWRSLDSCASRLAISALSCELSKTGAGCVCGCGLFFCGLSGVLSGCGLRVATAVFGVSTGLLGGGEAAGVTLRIWVSWNGACSVVFGDALCSRVPLPC